MAAWLKNSESGEGAAAAPGRGAALAHVRLGPFGTLGQVRAFSDTGGMADGSSGR